MHICRKVQNISNNIISRGPNKLHGRVFFCNAMVAKYGSSQKDKVVLTFDACTVSSVMYTGACTWMRENRVGVLKLFLVISSFYKGPNNHSNMIFERDIGLNAKTSNNYAYQILRSFGQLEAILLIFCAGVFWASYQVFKGIYMSMCWFLFRRKSNDFSVIPFRIFFRFPAETCEVLHVRACWTPPALVGLSQGGRNHA